MKKAILLLLCSSSFVFVMDVTQKLSYKKVKREAAWELEKDIIGLSNYIKGYPEIMPQIKKLKELSKQNPEFYQAESKPHVEVIKRALQEFYNTSSEDW